GVRAGDATALLRRLDVRGPRERSARARGLSDPPDGPAAGNSQPGPGWRDPRPVQPVRPPRQPDLQCRARQHFVVSVSVPRLDVLDRGPPGGSTYETRVLRPLRANPRRAPAVRRAPGGRLSGVRVRFVLTFWNNLARA